MAHYTAVPLPQSYGADAHVRFSEHIATRAIFFVHGFNGAAQLTWTDFPSLLGGCPACSDSNLYFISYDSLRTPANISAALLRQNLMNIWSDPAPFVNAILDSAATRPATFRYARFLLVAHSLGSIVARKAMVSGLQAAPQDGWALNSKLVVFAPAHKGANVWALAVECLSGIPAFGGLTRIALPVLKYKVPVLMDLEPGSPTLVQLESQTNTLIQQGCHQLKAERVIWAEDDRVIAAQDFAQDPPAIVLRGKDHLSVCKPTKHAPEPLRELEAVL